MMDDCTEIEGEDLLDDVFQYLTESKYPTKCTSTRKRVIRRKASMFVLHDGTMYFKKKKKRKVVELRFIRTRSEQLKILKACHKDPTAGHMGIKKTINRISERFFWLGIVADVKRMISSCDICQKVNRKMVTERPELHCVPVKAPWFHIGIDFIGPINPTSSDGNNYILTISDYFTKFTEAVPLPDKSALGVAKSLFKIFMRMGIPRLLTSDNGKEFKNKLDEELSKQLGIKRIFTTPYHPQANGLDERYNQTLQNMLVKCVQDKKQVWDQFLDPCIYAYNTAVHESTAFTPFQLMFGRKALLPIEIDIEDVDPEDLSSLENDNGEMVQALTDQRVENLATAKENILKAQERQKLAYDRKHASPNAFLEGDKVLKKDFKRKKRAGGKMDTRFKGPYVIIECLTKGFYKLKEVADSDNVIERVNGAHLKAYTSPSGSERNTDSDESDSVTGSSIASITHVHDEGSDEQDCETSSMSDSSSKRPVKKKVSSTPVFPLTQVKSLQSVKKKKKKRKAKSSKSWIPELGLHYRDKNILLSSTSWLPDTIINAVQRLLKNEYPAVCGLQDVARGLNMSFDIERGEFVQILHNGVNHWLTISTIGVQHPDVEVYDSKYRVISTNVKEQIASLLFTNEPEIVLKYKDSQIQSGAADCGLFAIASATALVLGKQPGEFFIDQSKMRSHLLQCFENRKMLMFPTKKARRAMRKDRYSSFKVFCICRMPEDLTVNWMQCSMCKEWYHTDSCVAVPSCYFEPGRAWYCTKCETVTNDEEADAGGAVERVDKSGKDVSESDSSSTNSESSDEAFGNLDSLNDVQIPSGYLFPDFYEDDDDVHSDNSAYYDLFKTDWRSIKEIWMDTARSHFRVHKSLKSDSNCIFKRDLVRQVLKTNEATWRSIVRDEKLSSYTLDPSKEERKKIGVQWPLELPDIGFEVEMYLKALQSDELKKKSVTGLHIAQYILWPEAMVLIISSRFEVSIQEAKDAYDNEDLTVLLANHIASSS